MKHQQGGTTRSTNKEEQQEVPTRRNNKKHQQGGTAQSCDLHAEELALQWRRGELESLTEHMSLDSIVFEVILVEFYRCQTRFQITIL